MNDNNSDEIFKNNIPIVTHPQPQNDNTLKTRQIVWKNNVPIVELVDVIQKETVAEIAGAALSLPYEDPLDLAPPKYKGRTNIEVAFMKAAEKAADGDENSLMILLDRFIGKPKQSIESKKLTMSYSDYLEAQAQLDKQDINP